MWSVSAEVAAKFLDLLWGEREGTAEVRVINETGTTQYFYDWPSARMTILEDVEAMDWDNVFMGVLLRDSQNGTAAHTEHETSWLWADVDKKKGNTFGELLSRISHYPQIIVDSGHGWHLYWRLTSPVPVDVAQGAMSVLADRLGGDRVGDAARVMRLPGTLNNKDDDGIPVRLLRYDPVFTHRFSDFDVPEEEPKTYTGNFFATEQWSLSPDDAPKFGEGDRNSGLTRLAGAMLFKGMDHIQMEEALLAENEVRCDPPLREREVRQIVRSVSRYR